MYMQTHTGALQGFLLSCKGSREGKSKETIFHSLSAWLLPCKYPRTFLFPPHSSHGMLSPSTCRLIPLLTAGQRVNWYPPTRRRQGSTLMKLRLGAPILAVYTPGVMISSVAWGRRIWLPQSSPGCLLMLTGPSQFSRAQQVCRHTEIQTQVHTNV